MKQYDLEQTLKNAVSHATPDVLEQIYARLDGGKGTENMEQQANQNNRKKTHIGRYFVAAAAAVAVFAVGIFAGKGMFSAPAPAPAATEPGAQQGQGQAVQPAVQPQVAAVIALDVNPSVEIKIDAEERVIEATAVNEDGKAILGDMDLAGSKADVAVNALVGAMLQRGYLDELANSILITVEGMSGPQAQALEQKLVAQVQGILDNSAAGGAILSQTLTETAGLKELAQAYGISEGKVALIQNIVANNTLHTFDELAGLSINELNLISQNATVENVKSTGSASDKAYIGHDKAKAIALKDAGVQEADVYKMSVELDYEHGAMVYEVEFDVGGYEYEYDVDAASGEILWRNSEWDDDYHHEGQAQRPSATAKPGGGQSQPSASQSGDVIGKEKAKAIALSHAGLSESQVYKLKCELDRDDGKVLYEVEFKADGYEYEYDIDAANGNILKWDKDWDD